MEVLSTITILAQLAMLIVMILISVAFFSLMERKVLSLIHFRKGPNKVVILGLLQPFADALKLLTKDDFPVTWSSVLLYYASPFGMMVSSLFLWGLFPFFTGVNFSFSTLSMMILLGLSVYGLIISSWSSNSKYAVLGGMRAVCQSISYEVVLSLVFLTTIVAMTTFSLFNFMEWSFSAICAMVPTTLPLMMVALLAELNRTPFDLSEGESELVSGYSVEYGGVMYTIMFLSENISIFFSSLVLSYFLMFKSTVLFHILWPLTTVVICQVRGVLPRLRYDTLMLVCWLVLMPFSLVSYNFMVCMIGLMFKVSIFNLTN